MPNHVFSSVHPSPASSFLQLRLLMSDPTRALQNLNLDDMPVTRSQARSTLQARGREGRSGSARVNPIRRPSRPSIPPVLARPDSQALRMQGPSGSMPALRPTVEQAQALFKVEGIVTEATQVDFRLRPLDGLSVSVIETFVFDSANRNHAAYCNQANHRRSRSPCNHIKWLVAGLTRELLNPTGMQPTTSETIRGQIEQLYPLITQQTKSLRTRLNAFQASDTDEESEVSEEESDDESQFGSATNVFARQNELCDILTSFHDTMLPLQFHQKYVQGIPPVAFFGDCLVENDLHASVYRLGMRDRYVFRALQKLVPGNVRATKLYLKQERRGINALERLDAFARRGELDPQAPNIRDCALFLRRIVHEIYEDLQARVASASVDHRAGEQCAACLIHLVEEVIRRRYHDYYEKCSNVPPTMAHRDRNIYTCLISDPPPPGEWRENWQTDLFVIERLPQTQWIQLYDRLDAIMNDIRESPDSDEAAAINYINRIARLHNAYNQTHDDPSSSSARPRMPRPE